MSSRLVALIIALVSPLILAAAPKGKKADMKKSTTSFQREQFTIPHQKFVLENGLTLLVHEDHSVPVVGVNLWYHVGSRNEKRGKTGFAHLFEHFFFNGSENHPHGFREAMDDLGANNRNGTTNTDRTNFFQDVPVAALERTLYLEADRMGFLAGYISKEMLERERGVVQNEKRLGENQPYGRAFSQMVETIYPYSHPYSWSTIGSMDDLNAASLEDIREWYRTYYGPNNCVLSLAGDITPERALELVKKYFGGIPPGPPLRRTEEWIPRLESNVRDQMEDRVAQTRIYRIYHAPAWRSREIPHLELLASVLSGSKSARLDRRLVYDKELATSVSAAVWDKELGSNFILTANVKPGIDPALVEREMDSVVSELLEKGATSAELQRAQSRTLADFVRGMERLGGFGGRSDILARSMTLGGSPDSYLDRLETLAKATPADLKKAGRTWLRANHYTLLVKPFPRLAAATTTLDRKILPPLGDAPDVRFPEVQRAKLDNGLSVILLERHTAPIVNVSLVIDAGYAADRAEKAGVASLALDLMDDGTTSRDNFQIVDELDALGAKLGTGSSLDLSFVRLQALPANLRASLDILSDVVLHPAFPPDLVALEKRRRLTQIAQEKSQPGGAAQRVLPGLLFGAGHAYSTPFSGLGFEKTVATITRDDLAGWHSNWFHPGNSTIIVTGDVTMEKVLPELKQAFSEWRPGTAPVKKIDPVESTAGGKIYLIDKPDAPQSVIVAAHVSETGGQPEDLAIEPVMRNFGGMATSRLMRNLRLEKHWSYGASATLVNARGQRPFMIVAPVQSDKTKESMIEIAKELRGVAGERPVAGEEFASIMRNMTLRLPARFETLEALEAAAISLVNYGYPDDYYANYSRNMRALTESSLGNAASKYVKPESVIWIVVGDLAKVEAGIRELGFGEVRRMNADGELIE
ncbi:MAG TPA: pitrilysin family protein [Thermoanaerobaculia bacterium]|nr:pitrilysin family protein [Thermoanaerobaculia bacterium]